MEQQLVVKRLRDSFYLTSDLFGSLNDSDLLLHIGKLPSNSFGQQVWCMIGARESYLQAIKASKWSGFSCSLKDHKSKSNIIEALTSSNTETINYLSKKNLNETQFELLLSLLEHEIQHHGQLIRYIYANKLKFPKSWNEKYTV